MSLADQRQLLADTLSTVTDVTGYVTRPTLLRTGDAWPILPSLDLEHGLIWRPTWRVLVVLPSDEAKAVEWVDTHFAAIVAALRGPAFPTTADLGAFRTEAGDVFLLDITLQTDPE